MSLLLLFAVFAGSVLLTGLFRIYALRKGMLDTPNARSSHELPTPRGGGNAIVISFSLAALAYLLVFDHWSLNGAIALLGAGLGVALIGWIDDHGHIAARWRLLIHFCAALWACLWLNITAFPPIPVFGFEVPFGTLILIPACLYLVWLLNLYNFMDGINGIAALEAISVTVGAAVISWLAAGPGAETMQTLSLLLAAATLGFLPWNFPNAKIFMGDAGSGFIGIVLGVLSLQSVWQAPHLIWCWLILLGVFIVDATYTLIRRYRNGEHVHEAHRNHAYQYSSRLAGSHVPVTLSVAAINLCFLLPVAILVAVGFLDGAIGVLIAYTPLLLLARYFKAGNRKLQCC